MTFISKVEDVFQITGRGCVLSPGFPVESKLCAHLKDPIHLKRPDGSVIRTHIVGLEHLCRPSKPPTSVPFLLPPEVRCADVPIGTEVWLDVDSAVLEQRRQQAVAEMAKRHKSKQ